VVLEVLTGQKTAAQICREQLREEYPLAIICRVLQLSHPILSGPGQQAVGSNPTAGSRTKPGIQAHCAVGVALPSCFF